MKVYTILFALVAFTWVSCNSESGETTGPIPANANVQQPPANTGLQFDTSSLQSGTGTQAVVPTGGSNLNPPHGQPGHRCDIEVGKPLDSKPVQATIPASTTPQNITTLPQPSTTLPPGANANPPHGQPGHRCDIAVGAPLK
jgi:hypothetical protein